MLDTAYFLAIFFIFIRITSFFIVCRVFFPSGTPNIMKGVLGIILAYSIVSGLDYNSLLDISNNYMLAYYMISEVLCGLLLGFIVNLVFEVVRMAGAYMDMQVGLSMLNVIDPTSKTNSTIMANLSYFIATVMFFIVDGHHVLIKCLIESFNIIPIGHGIMLDNSFEVILNAFIKYFVIGVRIAIPLVLIILITDVCMALISRVVPQINVMILGMPVKIIVGLITFVVFIPIFIKILSYSFDSIPTVLEDIFKSLLATPMLLIFANDDKTEEATPKKLSDAKKKGQIARSKDVSLALGMVACTMALILLAGTIASTLSSYMQYMFQSGLLQNITEISVGTIMLNLILKAALCILPVAIPIMVAGIVGGVMQTGFLLTGETLKPSFGKLNPISGFKNMFSKKSIADLIKNLLVVIILSYIGYDYVLTNYRDILQVSNIYLPSIGKELLGIISGIFVKVSIVMIILAAVDYFVQYKFFKKDMRMTKQEVKDEYKQMEGDPKVKGKIKQKQREMASRRMMESVRDATVVITNPTHLAIAIKYEDGKMEAPLVVAKGADLVALKIKEIALNNNVPIMENKPLARMLYEQVEIDKEIPQDLYQAVAEILAMVYSLKSKKKM
ncbi:MAG: fused FliR family export protein/FlhB family type III secretion system protein [Clostridiales bacterium]|nr:fused FliR family export protein/FlhB family type III secretion system protein [Clostridiales bacterium]